MKDSKNADFSMLLMPYDLAISHYDFVLKDLSSEIYDPVLQAQKEPVIAFLTEMRNQWMKCREDVQMQLKKL